jgi:hypothetical protein
LAAFARRHRLGLPRLYVWRQRLNRIGSATPATQLLPVKVVARNDVAPEVIEIELRGGRRLRVPETFDPVALGRVIDVLACSTC